ncbi:hypothetical protein OL548_09295 [Lysinibacillus sp. MHQ-1]|nr:hypothetical protein OL548_09295 [Lysinibacillus sp. MHQ-1]
MKFTNPIQSLVQGDFTVEGSEIAHSEISTDGKTVTFTLKTDLPEDVLNGANPPALRKFTVKASPSTVDVLGKKNYC